MIRNVLILKNNFLCPRSFVLEPIFVLRLGRSDNKSFDMFLRQLANCFQSNLLFLINSSLRWSTAFKSILNRRYLLWDNILLGIKMFSNISPVTRGKLWLSVAAITCRPLRPGLSERLIVLGCSISP